jgi:hypothetical protein
MHGRTSNSPLDITISKAKYGPKAAIGDWIIEDFGKIVGDPKQLKT